MIELVSKITFTQQSTDDLTRNKSFTFNFVHSCEIVSSWANLTDTAKLIFPRNMYFVDENDRKVTWFNQNVSGVNVPPLLIRGDKIKIELGYIYPGEKQVLNTLFEGFVSKVINRAPLEVHCEDNMWKLKQIACPNKVYPSTTSVGDIISDLVKGTDFKVVTGTEISDAVKTTVGSFRTFDSETVCGVLDRLRKDAKLYSYFRGNELRCAYIVYYPQDRQEKVFKFQENIISDDLEYKRLDDVKIGVKAYSVSKFELTGLNKNGTKKTQHKRLETFVGDPGGEIRTLYLWDIKSVEELKVEATKQLPKLKYEGFFGSFHTFGQPTVKHGDAAIIRDDVLPERNGTYIIKGVNTNFGVTGFRQKIDLHFRIDGVFTIEQLAAGQ